MRKLLSVDAFRMLKSKWLWLCIIGMLAMAVAFVVMQYTAMDYTVPLSRVIFLPMSFYGMACSALISLFVGEDFKDGFVRNKIIAGHSKRHIFISNFIVSAVTCIVVYVITTLFTAALGCLLFENDVLPLSFVKYLFMGVGMCFAYSCIYCTISMVCGNKTTSIVVCMGLAFFMLCACLHTNQVMVQPAFKNGEPNAAYVDGFIKVVYGFLHDFNPSGQAAQLSSMSIFHSVRWIVCDLLWILPTAVGSFIFGRKNIH